jgi:hypothetical protein
MRLTPSDTVDHINLNTVFQRASTSYQERILRRNPPLTSFCENFSLAALSTFSTESAKLRRTQPEQMLSGSHPKADIARYGRHVSNVPKADAVASVPLSDNFTSGWRIVAFEAKLAETKAHPDFRFERHKKRPHRRMPRGLHRID